MKKTDPGPWARLEQIIEATHHTTNSFAKHIGLSRGENLYQIRRGNNRISLDVALRIHERYPEYSISWLMCGMEDAPVHPEGKTVLRIPLYRDLWTRDFDAEAPSEELLAISASVANGVLGIGPHSTCIRYLYAPLCGISIAYIEYYFNQISTLSVSFEAFSFIFAKVSLFLS